MIKIHILYEHGNDLHPYSCSQIRLLRPLTHPLNQALEVSWGTSYQPADIIIVDRCWQPAISLYLAEALVNQIRTDKSCFIFAIDDNLLDLKYQENWQPILSLEQLRVVRYFLREADAVIVSTAELKQRFISLNRQIYVIPNTLDERLLTEVKIPPQPQSQPRKIIGYMGTYTHNYDVMMILQPLREILRKYEDKIELQILGGISDEAIFQAFEGLPVKVLKIDDQTIQYPEFMPWMVKNIHWDIALAPLENNPFNRCKSDIKFLDYSALGIAGVYSQVLAYKNTVQHLQTGYLAENHPQDWQAGLDLLLNNDNLRYQLATQAQAYVFSERILQHGALMWQDAILSILNSWQKP